jgi:hypothetical protein
MAVGDSSNAANTMEDFMNFEYQATGANASAIQAFGPVKIV